MLGSRFGCPSRRWLLPLLLKVSDLLIAVAYFSIALELLYFVAALRHLLPFRWVLVQFGAFIPHPFMVVLLLTAATFLTALVSFLIAITLLTLIPQLLRVKVCESLLWIKAHDLDREVVLMKRLEEASWHVRMLTQEIRRSLDRHTVLYTTLIELSRVLALNNCAIWMPTQDKSGMCLTHELRRGSDGEAIVSADDTDVLKVKRSDGVKLLLPDSVLGSASGGRKEGTGTVAAIRMPMLKVADFKGGTPEVLEIVEVVADQVAVTLSHASLLEESQAMRDRLAEQNRELLQARREALMANEARDAFQRVMSQGMQRPIHSILGLVSVVQEESLMREQKLVIDARTATVVSTLINDVMEMSYVHQERFPLETRPFHLHSMIWDAACVARCLCDFRGFGFAVHVENVLPDLVIGDERRLFHVLLHIVGNLIGRIDAGNVTFRVRAEDEAMDDQRHSSVYFVIEVKKQQNADSASLLVKFLRKPSAEGYDLRLSFSVCRKLVQAILDGQGLPESMTLVLRFQLQPSLSSSSLGGSFDLQYPSPSSQISSLKVLLIDDDDINLVVAQKLLEKLGYTVSSLPSGSGFMNSIGPSSTSFQLIVINLEMATEQNVWEKCAQSGINGVLKKPLVLQEVKEELTQLLQNT
ncbi:hypothetical protein BS78_04G323400 [Paspalum vaginatum]|nr:hypothetical protein BS78_04G323400 [Paspalum vaginatum]